MSADTEKLRKQTERIGGPGKNVPRGPQNADERGAGGPSEPFTKGTRKHQDVKHEVK